MPVKKYVLIVILLLIIFGAWYAYREYNRGPQDASTMKASETTTASALLAAYMEDEGIANKRFLGKAILVSGSLAEINKMGDTSITLLLGNPEDMSKVSCLLDKSAFPQAAKLSAGVTITIKGICTGYLADVELNRCIITEP